MKLSVLAQVLKKSTQELATTLNVAEDVTELSDAVILSAISSYVAEERAEEKGKQTRLLKAEIEKSIKQKFSGLTTKGNLDELLDELATAVENKIQETAESAKEDPDSAKTIKALNAKIKEAETKLKEFSDKKVKDIEDAKIVAAIAPKLANLDFASDYVKKVAIEEFLKNNKFIITDDDVFLEIDEKPISNFDSHINTHFSKFGKPVTTPGGKLPKTPGKESEKEDEVLDRKELFKKLRLSTDPNEIASINEKINSLSNQS